MWASAGCLVLGVALGLTLSGVIDLGASPPRATESVDLRALQEPSINRNRAAVAERSRASPGGNFLEEYIPQNLLPKYQQDNFQFPVSRSMLRQSRPVVGNVERLHAYLRKLQSGQCTTVLVLGGSISAGHHVKGRKNAYTYNFIEWLNERYPCRLDGGSKGEHEFKKTHASNSQRHFTSWSMVDGIERFDLVIFEFNVNDHFIPDIPHALEKKVEDEFGGEKTRPEYVSAWYFEVLLRRILLARKPDPPAVITFNADYHGRNWAPPPWSEPEQTRKTLFRNNQEPMKLFLSSMYEIPVFSASIWMLPLAGKRGTEQQFNGTYPYATSRWHTDACCHPRKEGHLILSLVLAYCMVEEEKAMPTYNDADMVVEEQRDLTALDTPLLRDPIYLSDDEEQLYVQNSLDSSGLDFTDPRWKRSWKDSIVSNNGWEWFADNADKDKFGYIANGVDGGQHIALSLSGGRHGIVEVSYVVSYENFGTALAWVSDRSPNTKQSICKQTVDKWQPSPRGEPHRLFAGWAERASVPKVDLLSYRIKEGEQKTLHICLTPKSEKLTEGTENKFKLLGVRVY
ncbi:hypothetical protein ACHAXT_011727 [Thalassiosira profunda]